MASSQVQQTKRGLFPLIDAPCNDSSGLWKLLEHSLWAELLKPCQNLSCKETDQSEPINYFLIWIYKIHHIMQDFVIWLECDTCVQHASWLLPSQCKRQSSWIDYIVHKLAAYLTKWCSNCLWMSNSNNIGARHHQMVASTHLDYLDASNCSDIESE